MSEKKRCNPLKIITYVLGGICIAAVIGLIFGLIVMYLWNWLMPVIFGLPIITFWQAWGLVLLSHILFKVGSHRGHSGNYKSKCKTSGEWKDKFRRKFHEGMNGQSETHDSENAENSNNNY